MEPLLPNSLYELMHIPSYLPGMLFPLFLCIRNVRYEIRDPQTGLQGSRSLQQEAIPHPSLPHISQNFTSFICSTFKTPSKIPLEKDNNSNNNKGILQLKVV